MRLAATLLLGLALLLAPLYAAIPDDPLPIWSSWLCAGTFAALLLAILAAARGDRTFLCSPTPAERAFLILLALAFLTIPARLIVQHGTGYLGLMLRGWAFLTANFASFALARRLARDPKLLYGLAVAAVLASAYVSEQGILEDLPYLLNHLTVWRVFSTSTPDYLAGYLLMLLPVSLALFLQLPGLRDILPLARHAATALLGLVILAQLAVLVATGSRFALVSLSIAFIVFGAALWYALRRGLTLDRTTRGLMGILLAGLLGAALVFARPVFLRLTSADPNSIAFRIWTWKGALKMTAANPLLGTGIGTWSDFYSRYALTGFTRAAHNSYLQLAGECGFIALIALLAALGWLGLSLVRGLASPSNEASATAPLQTDSHPRDHRLLLCGLMAALAGGVVQNMSDSDWYVFFLSATFWTLAGLAAGIVSPDTPEAHILETKTRFLNPILMAVGSIAVICTAWTGAQGTAAASAARAQKLAQTDLVNAVRAYNTARAWDPLNADYPSDQGYQVYYKRGENLIDAERALRTAVALEPNSVSYRKLGNILQAQGRQSEALAAYENGLRADPNSLILLLDLARLTPAPHSLDYYRRISDLELTPVGTVRALGESVETRFAIADKVMGDDAAKINPREAAAYYARAARVLEQFADLGGSLNPQQEALNSSHADPHLDAEMGGLYQQALTAWIALASPDQQDKLRRRQEKYGHIYDTLFSQSSKPGTL